ncbi:FUSC family protein [Francisella halioticida]|nr:FUSC family protein [Francisella halioticida]
MFGLSKELFYIEYSSVKLKVSIIATITSLISLFICFSFHITEPFFTFPAVFAIVSPNLNVILYKAPRRLLGTIVGSIVSICVVLTFSDYPFLSLIIVLILALITSYLSKITSESYLGLFLSLHILFIGSVIVFDPSIGFKVAENRLIANIIGIACTCVVFSFIYRLPKGAEVSSVKLPKKDAILYASVIIISTVIAITIWEVLKVPGGSLNMIISIITISGINNNSSLLKGKQRFIGCLFGICAAILTIALSSISIVFFFISFFCFATIFSYYNLSHSNHSYAGIQAIMGLCIMCFPDYSMEVSVSEGFDRVLGILLGVVIVNLVFKSLNYIFMNDKSKL